ncbi:MAG: FAD-dependent oxidoreductase [Alphaproteobacteria bacterium]|nr:FAD-dependent oxidoreductase [Alphaproteobacteria bacterium]
METLSTTCVIVGGGPAGMMCGYMLARAGVDVTVLEKHKDFLRDFRGDTVHPSTLQVMQELGLLQDFLKLPHTKIRTGTIEIGDERFTIGDFSRLPTAAKFIALMPQWDFLDFLAGQAKKLPNFHLLMQTEAKDLIAQGDRICGVLATGARSVGESQSDPKKVNLQIKAGLTIAADGRHSTLRDKSGLKVQDLGAPFDVLWLTLPVLPGDPADLIGKVRDGQLFVMIYRTDYWQCAYLIPKGGFDTIKADGLTKFRNRLKSIAGFAAGRIDEAIRDFDQVKLLTVTVDRLEKWARPGLLCIGDAAHAMSPIGGVGINLAIQDAVATANILSPVLTRGVPTLRDLRKVQKRREFPTKVIQAFQVAAQNILLAPTLAAMRTPKPPAILRLLNAWPWARQFPARFIGMGVRPEHARLPKR